MSEKTKESKKVKTPPLKTALKIMELKKRQKDIKEKLQRLSEKAYKKYGDTRFDYDLPAEDEDGNKSFYIKLGKNSDKLINGEKVFTSIETPEYVLETRRLKKPVKK